jgi:hypothetical protein
MATTTNYAWETPDDTDLVKDGAAAIRTLGSSIDTTTKALNPSTTEGDIEYRSATANTNTRLGIGTAGQVLTVNSGATAPEWVTSSSGGMTLISTTSANNSAAINLTSIPQTYNELYIYVRALKPANDGGECLFRFNNDSSASRYKNSYWGNETSTAQTITSTSMQLTEGNDNSVATGFSWIRIPDYANTTTWKTTTSVGITVDSTTTTSFRSRFNVGLYNQTTAITELNFFLTSGNITSGDFLLYGVK